MWSREEGLAVAREVFGFGLGGRSGEDGLSVVASGGPRSATGTEGAGGLEDAFAVTEVPLVVVVARLESRLAALEAAWARAESRVFDGIRRLIGEACGVREAIASGRTRVVGALVEDESGRVHWLGELPEQERMLAVDR